MDAPATAKTGLSVTTGLEKIFLSSVRLSSAATLFGVHQFESAVNVWQEGSGFGEQLNRLGSTVNSLTQCLVEEISPGKKEALDSITEMTGSVVRQTIEGMSLLDPRQAFRLAANLAQRSTDVLAGWTGRAAPAPQEEPRLAADVLGG